MSKTVSNVNGHQQTNNNNNVVNSESSSAAGPYLNFLDFDLNPENNDNKKTTEITTNELDLGKDLQSKQQSQSGKNLFFFSFIFFIFCILQILTLFFSFF